MIYYSPGCNETLSNNEVCYGESMITIRDSLFAMGKDGDMSYISKTHLKFVSYETHGLTGKYRWKCRVMELVKKASRIIGFPTFFGLL